MVTKKTRPNYFDIHAMIAKGIDNVQAYELPAGTVYIRPLSDIEIEEAQAVMLSSIKDPATKEYLFNLAETNELDKANKVLDEADEDEEAPAKIPNDVDISELYIAMSNHAVRVSFLALRDQTDEFKESDLKKLNGIRALSEEVLRISGYNQTTIEDIEGFR